MRVFWVRSIQFLGLLTALVSVCNAQVSIPATGIINTIAGNGTLGYSGDGGQATSAELEGPTAVAVDGSGNVYIGDSTAVRKIDLGTGIITTFAGTSTSGYSGDGGSASSAQLAGPAGIAFDKSGNIYIADMGNNRIRKVDALTGIINTIAGNGTQGYSGDGGQATNAALYSPQGLAVDSSGNVYFADFTNNRVREINASTGIITTIAGNGTQGYSGDGGLATNAEIYYPRSVAIGPNGNLYIADYGNHRIRSVNLSTGVITTVAGNGTGGFTGDGGAATSAEIGDPWGIAVDSFNNIYFADWFEKRVRMVNSTTGIISTVAGNGTQGYSGDGGSATNAEFYGLKGLGVDGTGNVYITDFYNRRVRLVGGSGVTGVINPKYVIVGVTYAPPGPNSYVQYTGSTYVGNTTTLSNSFTSNESLSISVGTKDGVKGWVGGAVTGTSSTSLTQGSNNSSTITISGQSSLSDKTLGTPNAFSPVNHDYDIIWLWLNPLLVYTANPNNPNSLTWNGYGYDAADQPAVDIYPIYVGYLNGDFGPMDSADATALARTWATGQIWPSGEGPGLTSSDLAQILGADPFSNSSYTVNLASGVTPATTADGRFTISGGANGNSQSFDYIQAAPGNGGGLTQQYTNTYTNSSTLGQGATYTTQQAFGIEEKFDASFFFQSVTYDLKQSQTLTWTNQSQSSITNTTTETDMLSITGPTCSGSPCAPQYSGPPEFDVYQDNLYGTFMFNPVN